MLMRKNSHCIYAFTLFILLPWWQSNASYAATKTIIIPFETLQPDTNGQLSGDQLTQYVGSLLQQELEKADLLFQGNGVTKSFVTPEMTGGGCTANVLLQPSVANALFSNSSSFDLTLDGIRDITLRLSLTGEISLTTAASVKYGSKLFGSCKRYASDSGNLSARANFAIDFELAIQLNPSYDSSNDQILLDKFAKLSATSNFSQIDIDGDFGGLNVTGILIEAMEKKLIGNFTKQSAQLIRKVVDKTNNRLNGRDQGGQIDAAYLPAFNDISVFQLPAEIQNSKFARQLLAYLGLPEILFETVDNRPGEILYIMLALEGQQQREALAELGATIMCDAIVRKFDRDLRNKPIYAMRAGQCTAAASYGVDRGAYFTDARCTEEVAFRPGDAASFCEGYASTDSKLTLGNAAAWPAVPEQVNDPLPLLKTQPWTTMLATRLDIGTISKEGLLNPYVKQVSYKTITDTPRGSGVCELEMRIYKPAIQAKDLRPVMALHGGTWSGRGFSFLGLEASIPYLMDKGHIVFVPFYRLVGQKDANPECQGAGWREILADVQDALTWVKTHAASLGARDARVKLFGQSAGAHLSVWLATLHPDEIDKVLALYPPLDSLDFFAGVAGEYQAFANFGLRALLRLYGADSGSGEIDISAIDFSAVDVRNPPESLVDLFPDRVFDFSGLSTQTNLPPYLKRCANLLNLDLAGINLQQPSSELLTCVKQDFSDYILETSFIHKLVRTPVALTVLQGTADNLVPPQQMVKLCQSLAPESAAIDLENLPALTEINCGDKVDIKIIKDAGHMLDFGLCVGEVCPAGAEASNSRIGTITALENAYDGFSREAENRTKNTLASSSGAVGAGQLWVMLLVLLLFVSNRTAYKKY